MHCSERNAKQNYEDSNTTSDETEEGRSNDIRGVLSIFPKFYQV